MREKIRIRETGVDIYEKDVDTMSAGEGITPSIRRFLVEEYHAILAGDREELCQDLKKVHVTLGLTDEADEALREIKKFYGFKCASDAIRLVIRNWLRTP